MLGRAYGDRDAEFVTFAQQSQGSLLRTAWLLTGSGDAAAELVQAALVKTYVAWPKIRAGGALAYSRRILANHRVDAWRSTRHEIVTDTLPERGTPVSTAIDDRDEIHRWLAGLPDQQRRVVVLRFYTDLSERDTADMLGISVGAVKSASSRGLAALRTIAASGRALDAEAARERGRPEVSTTLRSAPHQTGTPPTSETQTSTEGIHR